MVIVKENGFRNNGAATQTIAIPAPFTVGGMFLTGDTNTWEVRASGSVVNLQVITSIGNLSTQAFTGSAIQGQFAACDAVGLHNGAGSAHTGFILLIGM